MADVAEDADADADETSAGRLIGDTAEGGLPRCAFLTAHLSLGSETAARSIVEALARTMSPTCPRFAGRLT